MALDAAFLTYITEELRKTLTGLLVDKVYQPSKDEILLHLRGAARRRLMISCSPNAARIHLTDRAVENPKAPPNFCMVLRKHLIGAKVTDVTMPAFERVIELTFLSKNDFFEPVERVLLLEIMGRTSNIILLDEQGKIINAAKHVDFTMTRHREILPGLPYEMPPKQDKTDFLDATGEEDLYALPERTLYQALMDRYAGISPVTAREICYRAVYGTDKRTGELSAPQRERVKADILETRRKIIRHEWAGCLLISRADGRMTDFSFTPIRQYGAACREVAQSGPSALLEEYYTKQADAHRLRQKSSDLLNLLSRTSARITRTMGVRQKELENSENAETYQKYGQLVQAALHTIRKGDRQLVTADFYKPDLPEITIPLLPDKTPIQNAQRYFKLYAKAKKGRQIIAELIEKDKAELAYLDSVLVALCDAENEADIEQIRAELADAGLLKARGKKNVKPDLSHPRRFITDDGYTVLVGKNNLQNDYLTVRLSRKSDIWLHTKAIHGSHTLLVTGGKQLDDIPDRTLLQAAALCAFYSKAKTDSKVEVDYCPVGHVKKPAGAKPGMVIYEGYYTVVVSPDETLVERLREK